MRDITKAEPWLDGRTIIDCCEFLDRAGVRWRQLTLDDGTAVQIVLSHPWLILPPAPTDEAPSHGGLLAEARALRAEFESGRAILDREKPEES